VNVSARSARKKGRVDAGTQNRFVESSGGFARCGFNPRPPRAITYRDFTESRGRHARARSAYRLHALPRLEKILKGRRVGPDGNELPAEPYVFGKEIGDLTRTRFDWTGVPFA